ncbi:unnamed protein product [Angiostrongylus costaricensis]|uniref:Uncharacterized protein n=1 Tax=Angiostrongylus costaricensis TaxID=334426 RepID=A0A0R3PLJ3_ANGCS|nr:unnamed protein product [Angiostrongylus costaricensis]
MEGQQTMEDHECLVPMPTAKKYAGIQKFKISEADKVAIRPTYQKYYETPLDDMYDDEYDDGYEQKEFTVTQHYRTRSREDDARSIPFHTSDRLPIGINSVLFFLFIRCYKGTSSRSNYAVGRQRQIKERHKNAFKQRGADRKMRGMY